MCVCVWELVGVTLKHETLLTSAHLQGTQGEVPKRQRFLISYRWKLLMAAAMTCSIIVMRLQRHKQGGRTQPVMMCADHKEQLGLLDHKRLQSAPYLTEEHTHTHTH